MLRLSACVASWGLVFKVTRQDYAYLKEPITNNPDMKDKKQKAGFSGWTLERRKKQAEHMKKVGSQNSRSNIADIAEPGLKNRNNIAEPGLKNRKPNIADIAETNSRPNIADIAEPKRKRSNWTKEDTLNACFTPLVRSFIYKSEDEWLKRKAELLAAMEKHESENQIR